LAGRIFNILARRAEVRGIAGYILRPIIQEREREGGREGEREGGRKREREREREGEREVNSKFDLNPVCPRTIIIPCQQVQ
jgi:hypothetical protein